MKVLTICQPFAHLVAIGQKNIENRNWRTNHRGELAIHAGKSRLWMAPRDERDYPDMAFGAIVAIARLADCASIADLTLEQRLAYKGVACGPWCWALEDVRRLATPVSISGSNGLWNIDDDFLFANPANAALRMAAGGAA